MGVWTRPELFSTLGSMKEKTTVRERDLELTRWKRDANYWQTQHGRAVERERQLREENTELGRQVREQGTRIKRLSEENEDLKIQVALLKKQVFGRKTQRSSERQEQLEEAAMGEGQGDEDEGKKEAQQGEDAEEKRKRGKQAGTKGHGRRQRVELPTEEEVVEMPGGAPICPQCGKAYHAHGATEESEEIDWLVQVLRRIYRRMRYRKACDCEGEPETVTAPVPPKLIPKGMFSVQFWVRLMMEKYLFQRPLHRVRKVLEIEGLSVSQGTLTGGLERIGELLQPLYGVILEHSREAKHWHMDETRWLVFEDLEGKDGHRWWLWVSVSEDCCVFVLDPSRSAKVIKDHLGEDAEGIINADRYSAYKSLLGEAIQIAFCWFHVRQDFVRIADGSKKLRGWAEEWIDRIGEVYGQNDRRLAVFEDPEAFEVEDQKLRQLLDEMADIRDAELEDETLHERQRKALESLRDHWEGLVLFVDHPEIPMDNNEAERRLRTPVVGRKNYYGAGAIWSGVLSAVLFTLFETLLMNGIDPYQFLMAYLQACAENGGQVPENIEDFLPWNLSEERKQKWRYPKQPT